MLGRKSEKLMLNRLLQVLIFIIVIIEITGCSKKYSSTSLKDLDAKSTSYRDSTDIKLSKYLMSVTDSVCGRGRGGDECALFLNNSTFFKCLYRNNYERYKEVMRYTLSEYEFENTCYTNALSNWSAVHGDEEFFGMALELMKEDYIPTQGYSSDVVWSPVYEAITTHLIIPNIKSVSGRPFIEFARDNIECFSGFLELYGEDHHINCYNLLKPLWDAGEIELYGEEHFRKK